MNVFLILKLFSLLIFIAQELQKAGADGEITISELMDILKRSIVRFGLENEKIKISDLLEVIKNVKF